MLDLFAAIVAADPPSLVAWLVLAFAAAMYPLGLMLGAPCSPCCSCDCVTTCSQGTAQTVALSVTGFGSIGGAVFYLKKPTSSASYFSGNACFDCGDTARTRVEIVYSPCANGRAGTLEFNFKTLNTASQNSAEVDDRLTFFSAGSEDCASRVFTADGYTSQNTPPNFANINTRCLPTEQFEAVVSPVTNCTLQHQQARPSTLCCRAVWFSSYNQLDSASCPGGCGVAGAFPLKAGLKMPTNQNRPRYVNITVSGSLAPVSSTSTPDYRQERWDAINKSYSIQYSECAQFSEQQEVFYYFDDPVASYDVSCPSSANAKVFQNDPGAPSNYHVSNPSKMTVYVRFQQAQANPQGPYTPYAEFFFAAPGAWVCTAGGVFVSQPTSWAGLGRITAMATPGNDFFGSFSGSHTQSGITCTWST